MNKLQKLGESLPITDPTPTVPYPIQKQSKVKKVWWKRILYWLPLFALAVVAFADTYTYDQFGQINGHYPWPTDRDVWIFWPKINWANPTLPATPIPNYLGRATPYPSSSTTTSTSPTPAPKTNL